MAYTNRIVHFIPPAKFAEIETEFVEPRPDDCFIWWLFRYRCIVCRKPATEINEIIPRGRSKKAVWDWRNRVTLCHEHHTGDGGYHHNGVTNDKIDAMRKIRVEYLKSIGRVSYL